MFNTRLIDIREENELTQRKIAELLNISKSTYSRWETQEKIVPLKHLNNVYNKFNTSMDFILKINNKNILYHEINEIDKTLVGKRLKKIRLDNNLTQENLASILNTTHSTISGYENGKTLILTSFAYQICKNYNISMDWLCGRTKKTIDFLCQ